MPKVNVYLPDELAAAVRDAQVPVSAVCQAALERAVRDVTALRGVTDDEETPAGPFRKFTPRARRALEAAQQQAGDGQVGPEHLLLGVLDEGGNLAVKVLGALEVEPDDLRAELVASLPAAGTPAPGRRGFGPLARRAIESAAGEAVRLGHNYVGCEHLLLGVLAVEDGLAGQVLRRMGVESRTTRRAVTTALAGFVHAGQQSSPAGDQSTLSEILRRLDAIERRLAG